MTERYCKVCDGWHDLDRPWPHNCLPERRDIRSDLAGPMVISDTMQPVQSQLDGKMYDSKASLRASYRAAGVVEVGNDSSVTSPKPRPRRKPDTAGIKAAVGKAFSRVGLGA